MARQQPQPPVPQIHARLAAILGSVKAIGKDRQSTDEEGAPRFSYRGVDDVYNELHDLFAANGVYVAPELLEYHQTPRQTARGTQLHSVVKVRYRFLAADGSSVAMEVPGEAADAGDKGLGKACQYAYKLLLLQMFLIPTGGDNDPDAQSPEWAPQPQARPAAQGRGRREPTQAGESRPPQKSWRERVDETPPGQALRELTVQIMNNQSLRQEQKDDLLRRISQKETADQQARAAAQQGAQS